MGLGNMLQSCAEDFKHSRIYHCETERTIGMVRYVVCVQISLRLGFCFIIAAGKPV